MSYGKDKSTRGIKMEKWVDTIYTDGSKYFISNPQAKVGEPIAIYIRIASYAPVEKIIIQYRINGMMIQKKMKKSYMLNGLQYYRVVVLTPEAKLYYSFKIVTANELYYFTQAGIKTYMQDEIYAFKFLFNEKQPSWVENAVFYHLFLDRFYCGNSKISVNTGEYEYLGYKSIGMKEWNQMPLNYDQARCLDFYGGDLEGIIKKISYLKELGITAVYLSPIFSSPTVHKYDTIDFYSVDFHLGGEEALIQLSNLLHKHGIKLILDIAINHVSCENEWFNKSKIYFDEKKGAYNNANAIEREFFFMNDKNLYIGWNSLEQYPKLNYESLKLREIIYQGENSVLKKWLKEPYNIDGWRFDTATEIGRFGTNNVSSELWEDIFKNLKEVNEEIYLFGEEWYDAYEYQQGDKWDGAMNYFGCARPIRQLLGEIDLVDCGTSISKMRERNHYSAEDFRNQIVQYYGKLPWSIQKSQYNVLDSHDCHRLHNNPYITAKKRKMAIILQYSLVGAASIYYGDELDIDGRLDAAEGYRYPMPWKKEKSESFFYFYKKMNELKRNEDAFADGGFKFIGNQDDIVVIARFTQESLFLIIASIANASKEISISLDAFIDHEPKMYCEYLEQDVSYRFEGNRLNICIGSEECYIFQIKL